jgi:hypothetical protein
MAPPAAPQARDFRRQNHFAFLVPACPSYGADATEKALLYTLAGAKAARVFYFTACE